jgi:hypothetical protein
MNVRERVVLEKKIGFRHSAAQVERAALLIGKHRRDPPSVHAFVMHHELRRALETGSLTIVKDAQRHPVYDEVMTVPARSRTFTNS